MYTENEIIEAAKDVGKRLMKTAVRQEISDFAQTYRQAENEGDEFAKTARAVLAALMLKVNEL